MGQTLHAKRNDDYRPPNAAGLVVQLAGVMAVLVGAIVALGAVVLIAIGSDDSTDDAGPTVTQVSTSSFDSSDELADALSCVNVQAFDGVAHVAAEAISYTAPHALQCAVDDTPVFAYLFGTTDARRSSLNDAHLNRNLCTSFPLDAADVAATPPFEALVGANWVVATRDAAFADALNARFEGDATRQQISCTF